MNIPNIPTDNLYKFIAVSGLILMIVGVYFSKSTDADIRSEIFRLQLQQDILMLKAEVDSLTYTSKTDSITFHYNKKELQDKMDRLPNSYKAYFYLFLLGFASSIFGFVKWYWKLQIHQNKIVKNEGDKIDGQKSVITHQIRFEQELGLYKETWKPLFELRQHLNKVVESINSYHTSFGEEKKRSHQDVQKHLKQASKSFKGFFNLTNKNTPFYPKPVYDQISAITKIGAEVFTEAVTLEFVTEISELSGVETDSPTDGVAQELIEAIGTLAEIIRTRIEIIDIK